MSRFALARVRVRKDISDDESEVTSQPSSDIAQDHTSRSEEADREVSNEGEEVSFEILCQ